MSDTKFKPSWINRFLKLVERMSHVGKKVVTHPRMKSFFRQIWAHRLMVGLIVLVILLVGGVVGVIMDYKKTPDEVVEAFQEALHSQDTKKLQELVVSDHAQLSFGSREANDLIRFAQQDDDFLLMMHALHNQSSALSNKSVVTLSKEQWSKYPFYVGRKNGLLGETYTIRVRPRYVAIHVDQPGALITLDGKKVTMNKPEKKVGPFLPRIMKLKGVKKSAFSIVQDEQEVNLIDASNTDVNEYLHLRGQKIQITSELPETEILVNGKKIGKQVGPNGFEFGPISLNGQFKLSGLIKAPWGEMKSAETVIKEPHSRFDITPNPFSNAGIKKQLIQTINTYAQERVKAMKQVSTEQYTTIDAQYKSILEDDFEGKRKYNSDEEYKGEAIQTVIAVHKGHITFSQSANDFMIQVPVRFHYREKTYGRFDRKDQPLEEKNEEAYVWLRFDEKQKKWLITRLDTIFYSDDLFRDPSCVTTKF